MINASDVECLKFEHKADLKNYLLFNSRWYTNQQTGNFYAFLKINNRAIVDYNDDGTTLLKDSLNCLRLKVVISIGYISDPRFNEVVSNVKPGKNQLNYVARNGYYDVISVLSNDSVNVEIYAALKKKDSRIIQNAIKYVINELKELKENALKFSERGFINNYYVNKLSDSVCYNVVSLNSKGSYEATCAYPFSTAGKVFIKIKDVSTNEYLGIKKLTPYSSKEVYFHQSAQNNYQYEFSFLLNDGSYSKPINAIIEFWFQPLKGETKIIGEVNKTLYRFNREKR